MECRIMVNNSKIKGLVIKEEEEDIIRDACEWAAELEDKFYRFKDSLLTYDKSTIAEAKKEYITHMKKIWDFTKLGVKIIQ